MSPVLFVMKIDYWYSGQVRHLELPDEVRVEEFFPRRAEQLVAFADFQQALASAGAGPWLDARKPLLIVNDAYRTTPTSLILSWLDRVDATFLDRARCLIATGSHETPSEAQLRHIFGEFAERMRPHVTVHDAADPATMVTMGADPLGGEVWVHRHVVEHDRIVTIGSVEPHYFAGFTGGRKSIFPGLVDLATIERNHNLANSLEAQPLRLTGNPVAEHLAELTRRIDQTKVLSIQIVLDRDGKLAGVCCGSLESSFAAACHLARAIYAYRVESPYDIVVAIMHPPLDSNLYQLQKGLENCQAGVSDGGLMVLVSACDGGVGSEHFFALAERWDGQHNRPLGDRLEFGSHKLSRVIAHSRRIRVRLYSHLDADMVRQVFFEPLDNLDRTLFISSGQLVNPRVGVVHDAGNVVLSLQ